MRKYIFLSALAALPALPCISTNFNDSNLPIVMFSTGGQDIDAPFYHTKIIWMGIIDNGTGMRNRIGDPYAYSGKVEIEIQGSSTFKFPKKSWHITTIDNAHNEIGAPLFGLPAESDWVFKGLYQDKTFLRDELSFRIFNEMGHYSSRTKFFELVVNGDYRGVYQVEEKIKRDKNRVNISKLKHEDVSGDELTGGYIVRLDHAEPLDQGWYSKYASHTSGASNFFMYRYPKADSIAPEQKAYIQGFFDTFEDVLNSSGWNDPENGYRKYINTRSFIDMFLVNELSRNTDGYRLSSYFYKDRDSLSDGKLHAGPVWDYNIAWGNCEPSGGSNPYWWQYMQSYQENYVPFWWKKFLDDPSFQDELRCRWLDLGGSVLRKDHLHAHIDSFATYLDESQQRNFQRWDIMGQAIYPQPDPPPGDYPSEIGYLKWWVSERLKWLDAYIPGVCTPNAAQEMTTPFLMSVSPNPSHGDFHFSYYVPPMERTRQAQVVIELFNVMGGQVRLMYRDMDSGAHSENISASGLPAGIYTLRMSVNNISFSKKLVKL